MEKVFHESFDPAIKVESINPMNPTSSTERKDVTGTVKTSGSSLQGGTVDSNFGFPQSFVPSIQSSTIQNFPAAMIPKQSVPQQPKSKQPNNEQQFYNMAPFEDVKENQHDPPSWQKFWSRHPSPIVGPTKNNQAQLQPTGVPQRPFNQLMDVPTFSSDIAKLKAGQQEKRVPAENTPKTTQAPSLSNQRPTTPAR